MLVRPRRWLSALVAGVIALSAVAPTFAQPANSGGSAAVSHVLLISVDGMHAIDLENYIAKNPNSTLATLAGRGVRYPNAQTTSPSDSFPGMLALATGGTSKSTGVYYDDSYDRNLVAPVILGGDPTNVTCTPGSAANPRGTEVLLDETADKDLKRLDGGGGINTQALPRDPVTCAPVWPHSFVRVNTIFEVLKSHGYQTAWSDKHQAYDLLNGPSGNGIDDLYSPEVAAPIDVGSLKGLDPVSSETAIQAYDGVKVQAVINEIDGLDHSGTKKVGVPTILGMNFQTVSALQKVTKDAVTGQPGGYLDAAGTPTPLLQGGLDFVDQSLGRMVSELKSQGLYDSTVIIVTAKHGQAPIDPSKTAKIGDPISPVIDSVQKGLVAQLTTDDVALIWLTDSSKANAVAAALRKAGSSIGISNDNQVLVGDTLHAMFGDPATSATAQTREPDVVVTPNNGVIYTHSKAKIAEHGGFGGDNANVALLISGTGLDGTVDKSAVSTTQVAPTILALFGINPAELQAVQLERTAVLPTIPSTGFAYAPFAFAGSAAGNLTGNHGGSFADYTIPSPAGAAMTLTLSYSPVDVTQLGGVGFNVWQNGTELASVTALSTSQAKGVVATPPTATFTPSASGGPVLVQIFNYSSGTISYSLTHS
jgi:arylsulfatase A-like enzyme